MKTNDEIKFKKLTAVLKLARGTILAQEESIKIQREKLIIFDRMLSHSERGSRSNAICCGDGPAYGILKEIDFCIDQLKLDFEGNKKF